MAYCEQCGQPVNEKAKFCRKCGAAVEVMVAGLENGTAAVDGRRPMSEGYDKVIKQLSDETTKGLATIVVDYKLVSLINEGDNYYKQAETKDGETADRLFSLSCKKYEQALMINPDYHIALNHWGLSLAAQAEISNGEAADRLFSLSYEKYEQAMMINPDYHEALNNWGTALYAQAKTKDGETADRLLCLSCEKYEQALKIKPNLYEALTNWGNALAAQAKTKDGETADRLFSLSCEKHEQALKIKPNLCETLNNWGIALAAQAKTKDGETADRLLSLSCEKYEQALKIKPNFYAALFNWGNAMIYQSYNKPDGEKEIYLNKAEEIFLELQKKREELGTYGLVCINALKGNEEECKKWFVISRDKGFLPPKTNIEKDTDLDSMRDKVWFKEYFDGLEK